MIINQINSFNILWAFQFLNLIQKLGKLFNLAIKYVSIVCFY